MDYTVFEKLANGTLQPGDSEPAQAYMERVMGMVFQREPDTAQIRINEMLKPELYACDAAESSLSVLFTVADWALNPLNTLHGGIIATAIDVSMGILVRYLRKFGRVVTVQLAVNYLQPIQDHTQFVVRVKADRVGRRLAFLKAEVLLEQTHKIAATASAVFA